MTKTKLSCYIYRESVNSKITMATLAFTYHRPQSQMGMQPLAAVENWSSLIAFAIRAQMARKRRSHLVALQIAFGRDDQEAAVARPRTFCQTGERENAMGGKTARGGRDWVFGLWNGRANVGPGPNRTQAGLEIT
jgi:hypothetical protein